MQKSVSDFASGINLKLDKCFLGLLLGNLLSNKHSRFRQLISARSLPATNGHADTVKVLLEHQPDSANGLLLHRAVENGSRVIVDAVLAVNSKQAEKFVDWQDDNGDTAVHIAVTSNRAELIPVLHKAGADMGVVNSGGETPFFQAAEAGQLDTVRALLGTGADVKADLPNKSGFSPLMFVYMEENPSSADIVKELLGQVDVNRKHPNTGRTALHYATDAGGDERIALLLLKAGANPNIKNARGSTPLFLAAEVGRLATVQQLIEHGADGSITNNSNSTSLHRACQNGHTNYIEPLVNARANIDHESNHGFTLLSLAAVREQWDVVDKLIELNADLATALLAATKLNETTTKLIKQLWQRRTGETMKYLNRLGGKGRALLAAAITRKNDDDDDDDNLLELFLEDNRLDVTVPDATGHSPLTSAIFAGESRAVALLLNRGADPNERTREGESPLLARAAMEGNVDITRMLLASKTIRVAEVDSRKHTALYWAARSSDDLSNSKLFQLLFDALPEDSPDRSPVCSDAMHGAVASGNKNALEMLLSVPDVNVSALDSDGWTPLRVAASWARDGLKEMILAHSAFTESAEVDEVDPPTCWDITDKSRALTILPGSPCIVKVAESITRVDGWGDEEYEWAVARANHCVPDNQDSYFEVKIEKGFEFSELLGIGFCHDVARLDQMLGFRSTTSWAFHADDGRYYPSSPFRNQGKYGRDSQYKSGDTVGCGITASDKSIYFTLNGEYLGVAFSGIKGKLYPAVFMSTQTKGVQLKANFTGSYMYNPGEESKEGLVAGSDS